MAHKDTNIGLQSFARYEREVLKLAAVGYLDEEIADELSISERTVKEIEVHLMKKCNVQTISSAIDYALRSGLITVYEILEPRFRDRKLEVN